MLEVRGRVVLEVRGFLRALPDACEWTGLVGQQFLQNILSVHPGGFITCCSPLLYLYTHTQAHTHTDAHTDAPHVELGR